jgi:hypothetical protein
MTPDFPSVPEGHPEGFDLSMGAKPRPAPDAPSEGTPGGEDGPRPGAMSAAEPMKMGERPDILGGEDGKRP